jgi:hypothetical protein
MTGLDTRTALTIQDSMVAVMNDVREVAKRDRNEQQHFTFRGVDAVVNAVAPALRRRGVVVSPVETKVDYQPLVTSKGAQMMCCRVIVTYRFMGAGGDFIDAQVAGEAFDSGDKSTPKAMSVAYRTALLQALCLPTDDMDPDAQTYDVGESTAMSSTGQGTSPPSPRGDSGQAGPDGMSTPASPTSSDARSGSVSVDAEAPVGTGTEGNVTQPTLTGASANYLDADDQANLIEQYGGKVKAVNVYKKRFGERITRVGDITYEMRDELEGAKA